MAQVKDLLVKGQAKFLRKAYFQDQIVSNVAQGTAPLVVASSTVVSNLNSDYLDGYHASGLFTALSANSTLSITIGGTTLTSSINAATVDGKYISNYYTKSEADNRFVNVTGDTMTGALTIKTASYKDQLTIYRNENNNNSVINFSNKDGFLGAIGFTGLGQTGMTEKPHVVLKDSSLHVLLHDGNWSSYGDTRYSLLSHTHDNRYYTETEVNNLLAKYLPLAGGTMTLGEGLKFHADENYFGTNLDARIISLLDGNGTTCDGGLIIDERATSNGVEHVTELLRIRHDQFTWKGNTILTSGNYTSYLGYIGTTAVQASSAAQALSGITSINSRLSINAESDNTRLGFGGVHGVTFGEPGYAHRIYYFRPAYGSNGVTYTSLIIQNASAAASPTFTTTHGFDYNGNAYHSGNIYLDTGDSDRFIQFRYNSNNYAGASWRLLSRGSGSGDTNYFDIETGGSNASNNTWYRVIRLTMDNRYVGIGTDLPTYKLHIAGDSYTTGWSRAANGFYVEGTGVHFTHQGTLGEIDIASNNEFLWGSSTATLYFNYRAVSRGTTVNNYIWNAGSSTSWASHNMGNIWLNGSGVSLRLGPQNSSHAHYETTASVSHWFNKRVDVNGDIWRYGTNYGIASDGQFYAKAIYANRDGASTYGGISLYSTVDPITEYGIAFRGTGNYGKIGRVQGDWATYFTMDSSHNRGWIFRSGGTNYASVSARGEAYFNSVGTDHYIAYPSGGFFSSVGDKSGYIIITIPASYKSCTMMRFNVEIYNYSTGTSTTYTIGGYNYDNGNWYNVFAYANRQGTTGYGNLTVRFGHNGTNSIIWIGESNTSYSYPKVRITNVTLGHSNTDYNTWASGWSVTIATTAPTNVSQTVTNPATNYYAESAGSVAWGNVTGKPSTFAPSSHSHAAVDYLYPHYNSGDKPNPQEYFNENIGVKVAMTRHANIGGSTAWHDTLWINGYAGSDVPYVTSLTFRRDGTPRFFVHSQSNRATSYGTYYEVITAYNIGSQHVSYADSAGSANSVAWGNVTGKSIGSVIINKNNGTSSVYSSINYTGCLTASASGSGGTRTITITNNSSKAVRIACSVSSVYPANSYEFGWAHFTSSPPTSISANSSASFYISFGYIHCQGSWAAGDYVQRGSGGYSFSCIAYYEN